MREDSGVLHLLISGQCKHSTHCTQPPNSRTLKSGHTSTTGRANHLCASSLPKNAMPSATARSTVGTFPAAPAPPLPLVPFGGGGGFLGAEGLLPPPPPPPPLAPLRCCLPPPVAAVLLEEEEEEGSVPSQAMTMCRKWSCTWHRPLASMLPSRTHSSRARARWVSLCVCGFCFAQEIGLMR